MSSSIPPPLLLALSGPSSSGKTTLARHLLRLLPPSSAPPLLIHQDDFYKPEHLLPQRAGLVDWDSAGAIDMDGFVAALRHVKRTGRMPDGFESKEGQNVVDVGKDVGNEEADQRLRERVARAVAAEGARRIVVVEGFLLFGLGAEAVRAEMDVRLLLRARYADVKARRERRSGYVTLEGFWEDPEGYVELVVWPGYVESHAWLFEGGKVEGQVDERAVEREGIRVCPGGGDWGVERCLEWVVGAVEEAVGGGGGEGKGTG